jgi:hypothetical protein
VIIVKIDIVIKANVSAAKVRAVDINTARAMSFKRGFMVLIIDCSHNGVEINLTL